MSEADAARAVMEVLELVGSASDLGLAAEPALGDALAGVLQSVGASAGAVWGKEPTTGILRRLALRTAEPPGGAAQGARIGAAERPELYAALLRGDEVRAGDGTGVVLAELGLGDGVVVPLRAGGETLGALGVAPAPADRDAPSRLAVRAAARVLALALRNAQLFAGLQERARELDRQVRQLMALTEVARGVARSLDPAEVHRTIAHEARRLVRADVAVLLLEDGDGLVPVAAAGGGAGAPPGIAELEARGPVTVVPVPAAEGGRAGVIALCRRGEDFRGDDVERLSGLADQAAAALANAGLLADLRRERDERKALAAAMVQSQEQERQRVAEDLHDGPVQELVGLSLMLDALSRDLRRSASEVGDETAASAERAAASARDAVRTLRQAIVDLHPMALQELGLTAATRAVVQRLSWQGVEVDLDLEAADALPSVHRTVAFRVLQEAVANAVRHADPQRVSIAARRDDGEVVIEITDDGRGFDPTTTRTRVESGHLGLAAMRERAALAGGEVTIASLEGFGTTVRLTLPAGPEAAPPEG